MRTLTAPQAPATNIPAPAAGIADPSRGAPKIYVDSLKDFSGEPIDWEEWYIGTGATLGQTAYGTLLADTGKPTQADTVGNARDRELYNMLKKALYKGTAHHIIDGNAAESGHDAWMALKAWFGKAEVSRTLIDHYRNKLSELRLSEKVKANEYINTFILCTRKLEEKSEGYTEATKRTKFLDQIEDEDYDVVVQYLRGDSTKTFEECVQRIRSREQELERLSKDSTSKARRVTPPSGGKVAGNSKSKDTLIPLFPTCLLNTIKSPSIKKDLFKWRGTWNKEGRMIRVDELTGSSESGTKKDDNSVESDGGSHSKQKSPKKKRKKKARRTKTSMSGLSDTATPHVKFKDVDDSNDSGDNGDDSDIESQPPTTTKKKRGAKKEATKKKGRRNPVIRRGRTQDEAGRVVLDGGTEFEVIGGIGWRVLEKVSKSAKLHGWGAHMDGPTLPIVNAVTAYDHPETKATILLGLGGAAYDERIEQTEALVNTHVMRRNNVTVHDVAERDGGLQRIELDDAIIKLDFTDDEKLLTFAIREPTLEEVESLNIYWLTPRIPSDSSELLKQSSRRGRGSVVEEEPTQWNKRLGNSTEFVTMKTLSATTQLCSEPVEMENREAPRQHRKKRLIPLHPNRLEGRTDSDTFFSTIKSIRSFTCVQLFVHLGSQFLFARCMTREAKSHGAYQDFVREVGAPNILLTDNSQTQSGTKWTKTSRENITKQIHSVPHNQNQNQTELKVRDIKTRVILSLRLAKAPLAFWCYAMMWVIDCLNHSAHKGLDWRTPVEKLTGNTPDISVFRFSFWQPVYYYEPTAKYPKPNFLPGRFVGIAWNHGDAFTYRIWTCPNGNWENGLELIRNIVRPRKESNAESIRDEIPVDNFTLKVKVRTKRGCKRKKQDEILTPECDTIRLQPDVESAPPPQTIVESTVPEEQGGEVIDGTNPNNGTFKDDIQLDFDPLDAIDTIEMADEINDELAEDRNLSTVISGSKATHICGHCWKAGQLELKVNWDTEEVSWEAFNDLKVDHPNMTAAYIVENNVTRSNRSDRTLQWAKKTVRDIERAVRQIARLYDHFLDDNDEVHTVRRLNPRKKKRPKRKQVFKYGVEVPCNVAHAKELDEQNGNTYWQEAIEKEISSLVQMECFEFKPASFKPGSAYQWTTLTVIFDVKQDLRWKARLVAGGHLVDALENSITLQQ